MINDLEEEDEKKISQKKLKRTRQEALGTADLDMNESSSDDEDTGALKKKMQGLSKKQKINETA